MTRIVRIIAALSMVTVINVVGLSPAVTQHQASATSSPHTTPANGYRLVASDGGIFSFGDAGFYGSTGGQHLNRPIVGMAATPDAQGYWLVASDGGIFSFGDAGFYGSTGGQHLNRPIVGMAATPDAQGYWLVASDGGIFSFGDAHFYGSTGNIRLNQPIVGMAATPDGRGYWLVASDGGMFSFGDAGFYGSTGGQHLNRPIVGMAATPDAQGYWLVASDGGIFSFGDASFYGSTGAIHLNQPIAGMGAAPDGRGYWLVASDGGVFSFGDAQFFGSLGAGSDHVVGISTTPEAVSGNSLREGAYVGPPATPAGMSNFTATTGTYPTIASDYLPDGAGWAGMDGSGGSFSWLFAHRWTGSGYILSLGVPIIPTDSNGNAAGTLATGATGAYDAYFVTLAQNLVAAGESNAYLRLGWEFDGNGSAWSATTSTTEASYAAYFQQIVTSMRSVSGENFKFVWNPNLIEFQQNSTYDLYLAYPGNAYVDDIGIDAYDRTIPQTPSNSWPWLLPALNAAHQFAAARSKPLAVPEWGVQLCSGCAGLGDDPAYINNFTAWMKNPANDVAYESIFDVMGQDGINANITSGSFPNSLTAFRADMD